MSKKIDLLKDEIIGLFKGQLAGLWQQANQEFMESLALDLAREKVLMAAARTKKEKKEHADNIIALEATVKGEVVRLKIVFCQGGEELFYKVIGAIIRTIALSALGV